MQFSTGKSDMGFVRLSDPKRSLWACDYVMVYPKMYRASQPEDFYHPVGGVKYEDEEGELIFPYDDIPSCDRPGISGVYMSVPEGYNSFPLNELIITDVEMTCGTLRLSYAILTEATDSYLTIKLLKWKVEDSSANVYGKIFASCTRVNDHRAKTLVFDRRRDEETLFVKPEQYVPLQKPTNIVLIDYSLKVDICIFHKNDMGLGVDDDFVIAKESLCFEAQFGTEE